jgi:hypothetical protein
MQALLPIPERTGQHFLLQEVEEAGWVALVANLLPGPELGPESTFAMCKLSKEGHQVADITAVGCSLLDAQTT